ncbi:endonuclease/exonuclease/phosphatase family protein [Fluviibacterium sp. DFM31]|uniref:Endonuclease/exonuclease/phosphatase family protein n=1 Tax=Meridianimarinicoccus marinus TaxID=3231483 RepID=A0ABV3L8L9_9RHOB
MPSYHDLRPDADFVDRDYERVFPGMTVPERARCSDGLLRLRAVLNATVAPRKTEGNLLVASWNIKEFGHTTQRLPEAYFYIAEILGAFDLIAVQEVKSTLTDLHLVMRLLGPGWRYLVNDITDGASGNSERSAYIFNAGRVQLSGLAGEISLWDEITRDSPLGLRQLKRAPYVTGFRAGWKEFAMVNLHLHPGDDADDVALRGEEIRLLLKALKAKRREVWSDNLILVGDWNLYEDDDQPALQALADAGYRECSGLQGKRTNVSRSQAYDRMFFTHNTYFQMEEAANGLERGDVLDPFDAVYRESDLRAYRPTMLAQYGGSRDLAGDDTALARYFRHPWRKNQLSDHFPIWVSLVTDQADKFLKDKRDALAG